MSCWRQRRVCYQLSLGHLLPQLLCVYCSSLVLANWHEVFAGYVDDFCIYVSCFHSKFLVALKHNQTSSVLIVPKRGPLRMDFKF